jgi:hypothetical protein
MGDLTNYGSSHDNEIIERGMLYFIAKGYLYNSDSSIFSSRTAMVVNHHVIHRMLEQLFDGSMFLDGHSNGTCPNQ